MSKWLNNTVVLHEDVKKLKLPCTSCGYCPYGSLVEAYPITQTIYSCEVFGHDCPAYYLAEVLHA